MTHHRLHIMSRRKIFHFHPLIITGNTIVIVIWFGVFLFIEERDQLIEHRLRRKGAVPVTVQWTNAIFTRLVPLHSDTSQKLRNLNILQKMRKVLENSPRAWKYYTQPSNRKLLFTTIFHTRKHVICVDEFISHPGI